jgi:hypothetical protein
MSTSRADLGEGAPFCRDPALHAGKRLQAFTLIAVSVSPPQEKAQHGDRSMNAVRGFRPGSSLFVEDESA